MHLAWSQRLRSLAYKMLDRLPIEMISTIVANLLHVDLKSLSLVSYRLRAITLPFLFRTLKFTRPAAYDDQETLFRLKSLATNETILCQVHRVTISGEHRSSTYTRRFEKKREFPACTVTPYMLSLPFPNLRRLWLADLSLDNTFLLALIDLATRRDVELSITRCQLSIDVTLVSALELHIVAFAATREIRSCGDVARIQANNIYHIISASSRHLRHLNLASQLLDLIDRLLQVKFDSLQILQLYESLMGISRIPPSTLSKFLRQLGPLDKLILSPTMRVVPEILFDGVSKPPKYNSLEASYQVCRILLPNNTVASLCCRNLFGHGTTMDEERELIPIIEEGLRKNQKPLRKLEIAAYGQEEDRILVSLAGICVESLKSLHLHITICVSQVSINDSVA